MPPKSIFIKTEIMPILSLMKKEYDLIYHITTIKNAKLMKSYAQVSIIATGGWLEDSLKELSQLSIDKLKNTNIQKKIIESTNKIYGFSYTEHFSKAINLTLGVHGLEYVESKVGSSNIVILSSVLAKLKKWRDEVAHSHKTIIPVNPTQVINEFNIIFPILKKIEKYTKMYIKIHF